MADNVRERLEKRQEERLLELDRRRQERAEQTRPEETPVSLISTFVKEKEAIEKMLSDLTGLEKNVLRERFDELTRKSQLLQKFLSDSHAFLPSYDAKQLQQQSSKLEQDINEKRSHYLPKKKFAFSKKKQAIGGNDLAKKCVESEVALPLGDSKALETNMEPNNGTNKDRCSTNDVVIRGQKITREQTDLLDKDISFSNLIDSVVILHGAPSALHLKKLQDCKVFCGPVNGAVFINDCKDCTFIFPCQQLRVHTTVRSQFYLHVTSRAIIEDCQELGFAEFNWSYEGMDEHFRLSRLDQTKNNWQLVNDFNWLKADTHSPNWHLIKNENKVKSWN